MNFFKHVFILSLCLIISSCIWRGSSESSLSSKSSESQGAHYKKQIYQIKCWIDDIYAILPTYKEESEWEKERIFDKLKGNEDGE